VTDRAQMGPTPRWPSAILIGGAIMMLIGAEVRDRIAAAPFAQVEYVCGLCGADWTPAASLLIIGALVAIAAHTVSFVKWPPEEERDE